MQSSTPAPTPAATDIVAGWLAAESGVTPDCEVVRAIQACTDGLKLDEVKLLAKLKRLGEPGDETDVPR